MLQKRTPFLLLLALTACGNSPAATPASWWHDLQGGVIAEDRPPPPGADLPYPHIGTIPPKPILPGTSYRDSIQNTLAQQRDDTERLATRTPVEITGPNPLPVAATAQAVPAEGAASAQLPAADPSPVKPQSSLASAVAPGAPRAAAAAGAPPPADGPPPGAPVTLAGDPLTDSTPNLPTIPDAPPAPASFEGVPSVPTSAPPAPLPARLPPAAAGAPILFAPGSAVLDPSQTQPLKDFIETRAKRTIEIEGHGDSRADAPEAQEKALQLGLQRAQAVAKQLAVLHVPQTAMRLSATAFGRDASLRYAP